MRARRALSRPIAWDGHLIDVVASFGATLVTRSPGRRDLFAEADGALYAAKAAGGNAVRLFEIAADPEGAQPFRARA